MTGNMTSEELQVIAFDIILHSGNARTLIHEAFKLLRQGEKAEASQQLDKANEAILEAHKAQTNLLKEYASGQKNRDGDHHGPCPRPFNDNNDPFRSRK